MKKVMFLAVLLLATACEEKQNPAQLAHKYFVEICKSDERKAEHFNCECEAEIIDYELNDAEMIAFVNFLILNKEGSPEAPSYKEKPEFKSAFDKIIAASGKIKEKCAVQ